MKIACKHVRLNADGVCDCGYWVGNPSPTIKHPWTEETMEIINRLTFKIKEKAFDPDWFLLRQRFEQLEGLATFRRSPQNQTVSGGVEGAHEGTTADKSGSREPEKLNNAQKSAEEWAMDVRERYDPVGQEGFIRLSTKLFAKELDMYRNHALAESSLSSPPPICKVCGHDEKFHCEPRKRFYRRPDTKQLVEEISSTGCTGISLDASCGCKAFVAASPELLPTQLGPISKHPLTPEPQSTQLDTGKEK